MARARYRICRDADGEWFWALIAPNGKAIAEHCTYYKTRSACMRAINSVRKHARTIHFQEEC